MGSPTNIYTFYPYDVDKNLGRAYNSCMDLLQPDDWGIFVDHDTLFTQADWGRDLRRVIEENPEYGLFTGVTNRIGNDMQLAAGVDSENHDISYHMEIGREHAEIREHEVIPYEANRQPMSGFLIIIQKKVWDLIGGAKDGFYGVDNDIHNKCRANGIESGIIRSLYLYHWYRGDNSLKEARKLSFV